jgi:hypothetical protein
LKPSAGATAPTFGIVEGVPAAWEKAIEAQSKGIANAATNFSFKRISSVKVFRFGRGSGPFVTSPNKKRAAP